MEKKALCFTFSGRLSPAEEAAILSIQGYDVQETVVSDPEVFLNELSKDIGRQNFSVFLEQNPPTRILEALSHVRHCVFKSEPWGDSRILVEVNMVDTDGSSSRVWANILPSCVLDARRSN